METPENERIEHIDTKNLMHGFAIVSNRHGGIKSAINMRYITSISQRSKDNYCVINLEGGASQEVAGTLEEVLLMLTRFGSADHDSLMVFINKGEEQSDSE